MKTETATILTGKSPRFHSPTLGHPADGWVGPLSADHLGAVAVVVGQHQHQLVGGVLKQKELVGGGWGLACLAHKEEAGTISGT